MRLKGDTVTFMAAVLMSTAAVLIVTLTAYSQHIQVETASRYTEGKLEAALVAHAVRKCLGTPAIEESFLAANKGKDPTALCGVQTSAIRIIDKSIAKNGGKIPWDGESEWSFGSMIVSGGDRYQLFVPIKRLNGEVHVGELEIAA